MINLENRQPWEIPNAMLLSAAGKTQAACGSVDADLSIVITGDEDVRILNQRFLGIDAPTDVLSFPAGEIDPETGRGYLGDVIISLSRAVDQAVQRGHSTEAELQVLVVHGVLHLLGYDHATSAEKNRMWSIQGKILAALGLDEKIIGE